MTMENDKKHNKVKIFMFLVFVILLLVFFVSVVKMIRGIFYRIEQKNAEFRCVGLKYDVDKASLAYQGNGLLLEIRSRDYGTNITKITILSDADNSPHTAELQPGLMGGEARAVKVNGIMLDKGFYLYANDCTEKRGYYEI